MSIPIEAYTLVIQNSKLEEHLLGGVEALRGMCPNSTFIADKDLSSISFMAKSDGEQFYLELVQACPTASPNALDGVFVSGAEEPPERDWLSLTDWEGSIIAWKAGEDPNPLMAPEGWEPGKSSVNYCTQGDLEKMEYLGVEDGVEVYRDPESGEKRYVGRTESNAEKLYAEGCEIIKPFIEIVGRTPPDVPEEERIATLRRGIEVLEIVLATNPDTWGAHWNRGKAFQALGENEQSYAAFATAYDLEKGNPNIAREFMKECLELGRIERAIEASKHAVKIAPDDDGHVSNLALALLFAGRHKEALKTAKRALKMKRDPITKNLVGYIKDVMKGRKDQPRKFSDL